MGSLSYVLPHLRCYEFSYKSTRDFVFATQVISAKYDLFYYFDEKIGSWKGTFYFPSHISDVN